MGPKLCEDLFEVCLLDRNKDNVYQIVHESFLFGTQKVERDINFDFLSNSSILRVAEYQSVAQGVKGMKMCLLKI